MELAYCELEDGTVIQPRSYQHRVVAQSLDFAWLCLVWSSLHCADAIRGGQHQAHPCAHNEYVMEPLGIASHSRPFVFFFGIFIRLMSYFGREDAWLLLDPVAVPENQYQHAHNHPKGHPQEKKNRTY
jgi:hypothetical protein